MGQNLTLARYPIRWHLVGDAKGQYVKNAAIHDTYNRCVTVHGTNDVRVENNVTYNTVGHCFFLEDGIEHGNEFAHNLAIQIKCHVLFLNSRNLVRRGQMFLAMSVPRNWPCGCSGNDNQKPFSSEPAATLSTNELSGLVIQYADRVVRGQQGVLPGEFRTSCVAAR